MRLLVKVHGQESVIVGYGPGTAGQPKAIVILDGQLHAVELKDIELQRLPKQLRHNKHHRKITNLAEVRSNPTSGQSST